MHSFAKALHFHPNNRVFMLPRLTVFLLCRKINHIMFWASCLSCPVLELHHGNISPYRDQFYAELRTKPRTLDMGSKSSTTWSIDTPSSTDELSHYELNHPILNFAAFCFCLFRSHTEALSLIFPLLLLNLKMQNFYLFLFIIIIIWTVSVWGSIMIIFFTPVNNFL